MKEELKKQDSLLKDAQFRKSLSIAFFNATNASIELVKNISLSEKETQEKISFWRNWFLEEHKNYYATVIANVGVNYKVEDSIAKLKEAKTIEDLNTAWRLLSADERRDGEIIKVAQQLKKKYA